MLALVALLAPVSPLAAQTGYPAINDVDPATALGRYLRMLASNPRDLASLTGAGRAALAVGDANAALAFYARAEEISPRNGRIKAGLAAAMVQMEQPRVALKLFDEAVALGVPAAEVAGDRGLAHDLVGDNRRAQADYTVALRAADSDEIVRRLALSMAVSGDRDGALAVLSPLLRRHDGAAERARAFVLALTGDQAGAANAVRAAMPGPPAGAMTGFMTRLATLNPAQKALAVNFGYFPSDGRAYNAAELFADARAAPLPAPGTVLGRRSDTPLIPVGEALGPRLAANEPVSAAPRRRPGGDEVAPPAHVLSAPIPGVTPAPTVGRTTRYAALPAVPQVAAAIPPVPTGTASANGVRTVPQSVATTGAAPLPARSSASAPTASYASPTAQAAAGVPAPAVAAPAAAAPVTKAFGTPASEYAAAAPAPGFSAATTGAVTPAWGGPVVSAGPTAVATGVQPYGTAGAPARIAMVDVPAGSAAHASDAPPIEPVQPLRVPASPTRNAPRGVIAKGDATRAGGERTGKPTEAPARTTRATAVESRARAATSDASARPARAAPTEAKSATAKGAAKDAHGSAADAKGGRKTRLAALETDKRSMSAKKGDLDKREADGRIGKDDTKAKSGKDAKPGRDARNGASGKDAKPAVPERYWVQVASGSNKADLDKAWNTVKGKAPKQLSGQSTYTSPWRASNRLLIGPFKTADEAQAKVNSLARAGVSGIQFTTRAGADVEKVAKN